MKILVACEESQAVALAMRKKGHEAYSCDIIPCSGGRPDIHILGNVLSVLNGNTYFLTEDNVLHRIIGRWDMIIGFPPCTNLAVRGARWFEEKRRNGSQKAGIDLFYSIYNARCGRVAVENPVGIISGGYIKKWYGIDPLKPTQIIQPWQFGHGETKATCLWLRGLPALVPTNIVEGRGQRIWKLPPSEDRAKLRSKTFLGVAEAMAEQWGKEAIN